MWRKVILFKKLKGGHNMKKRMIQVMGVVLLMSIAILMSILPTLSLEAAEGSLRFVHGNIPSEYSVMGKTTSTKMEYSMKIEGNVYNQKGQFGSGFWYYFENTGRYSSYLECLYFVGWSSGTSFFKYYVDGRLEHQSTARFPYNFIP